MCCYQVNPQLLFLQDNTESILYPAHYKRYLLRAIFILLTKLQYEIVKLAFHIFPNALFQFAFFTGNVQKTCGLVDSLFAYCHFVFFAKVYSVRDSFSPISYTNPKSTPPLCAGTNDIEPRDWSAVMKMTITYTQVPLVRSQINPFIIPLCLWWVHYTRMKNCITCNFIPNKYLQHYLIVILL